MFVSNHPRDQGWRTVLKSNDETIAISELTVWGDGGGPTPPTTYWTRAEVRARDGRLLMLSNPIYIVTDLDRSIEDRAKGGDKPPR